MNLKAIVATVLISTGFLAYVVGLIKMSASITIVTACGSIAIVLVGFTLIIIGGFMTLS